MAEGVTVTLDLAGFDRFEERAAETLSRAVFEAADQVVDDARALAPVATGALRDSLHVEVLDALLVEVGDGVDYGVFQELGTSRIAPRPFLTPALEAERERFPERVAAALAEAVQG